MSFMCEDSWEAGGRGLLFYHGEISHPHGKIYNDTYLNNFILKVTMCGFVLVGIFYLWKLLLIYSYIRNKSCLINNSLLIPVTTRAKPRVTAIYTIIINANSLFDTMKMPEIENFHSFFIKRMTANIECVLLQNSFFIYRRNFCSKYDPFTITTHYINKVTLSVLKLKNLDL